MNKDFIKNAIRTENQDFNGMSKRLNNSTIRLLHGGMGVSTEANELLDALKKHIFYGKELDVVNVKEEIGDILYYCAILLDELDSDFDGVSDKVIKKLRARYPEKFSQEKAIHRDLDVEREILENE